MPQLTIKELKDWLEEYSEEELVGIAVWNPISKCFDYSDIQNISVCRTPGYSPHIVLETKDDLYPQAYENSLKPKNKLTT